MKEDTSLETPAAKGNSDPAIPLPPGAWKPPRSAGDGLGAGAVQGAGVGWAIGSGQMRTFRAKGIAGVLLGLIALMAIGTIFALAVLFAVSVGAAVAVGAGVAALLGMGATRLRRRIHPQLGPGPGTSQTRS